MTQQALSKARSHFDHTPFMKAFYVTVQAEYNKEQDAELPRRSGYKFIAIDGSVTALPNLPELAFQFGSVNGSPSARTSIALDVLQESQNIGLYKKLDICRKIGKISENNAKDGENSRNASFLR